MLHPSYTDLMAVVNSDVEQGEHPVVQSRYSIVLATAKRARQIIAGQEPLVKARGKGIKPLSIAVEELHDAKIKIVSEEDNDEEVLETINIAEESADDEVVSITAEEPAEDQVEE